MILAKRNRKMATKWPQSASKAIETKADEIQLLRSQNAALIEMLKDRDDIIKILRSILEVEGY